LGVVAIDEPDWDCLIRAPRLSPCLALRWLRFRHDAISASCPCPDANGIVEFVAREVGPAEMPEKLAKPPAGHTPTRSLVWSPKTLGYELTAKFRKAYKLHSEPGTLPSCSKLRSLATRSATLTQAVPGKGGRGTRRQHHSHRPRKAMACMMPVAHPTRTLWFLDHGRGRRVTPNHRVEHERELQARVPLLLASLAVFESRSKVAAGGGWHDAPDDENIHLGPTSRSF